MGKNEAIRVFGMIVLATIALQSARATTTTWIGPSTGGVFNDDDNWDNASPGDNGPLPHGPNDRAVFDTTIDGTITFNADATHADTDFKSFGGTLTFDTGAHKWITTNVMVLGDSAGLGAPGYPKVRFVGGYIEAFHFIMGNDETSPGASLEITNPGTHFHTIRGSGGLTLGNGPGGDETDVWVHNGARLSTDGQTIVGLQGSSDCLLMLEGAGTSFSSGNYLGVGHTGHDFAGNATNNKAIIRDGVTASSSNLYMGITTGAPNNEIVISGAGTTYALPGVNNNDGTQSLIGWRAPNNVLRIEDGAVVTGTNYFIIGNDATSNTGNQIILSNSSLSSTGMEPRRGSITITNSTLDMIQWFDENLEQYKGGGILAPLSSSVFTFNSGTVRGVNATVTNGSAFNVGNGSATPATYFMRLDQAGARGTHSFANGLTLASNGVLAGNGNVTANVSGAAGAKVDVGDSAAGIINVTGNWNNTGIGIALELDNIAASTTPGDQFDQLSVTGAFTHGGTVSIDVSQLIGPTSPTQLKLIGWGSQVGASASTIVSFLGGAALPYAFQADGLYVTALASAALAGDYNSDGRIDAADYTVWRDNLGAASIPNRGAGITGPVGVNDYNYWKTHFGEGSGSGALLSLSVPEPVSWCLILTVVAGGLGWRRSKSRNV